MRAMVRGPALGLPPLSLVNWLDANDTVGANSRRDSCRDRRNMFFRNSSFARLLRRLTTCPLRRQRTSQPVEERESR